MIIAIDFDGTIVEHKYPEIGREIPFAMDRHKLINGKTMTLESGYSRLELRKF